MAIPDSSVPSERGRRTAPPPFALSRPRRGGDEFPVPCSSLGRAHRPDVSAPAVLRARVLAAEDPEPILIGDRSRAARGPRGVFGLLCPRSAVGGLPDVDQAITSFSLLSA